MTANNTVPNGACSCGRPARPSAIRGALVVTVVAAMAAATSVSGVALTGPAHAQAAHRDAIADLIRRGEAAPARPGAPTAGATTAGPATAGAPTPAAPTTAAPTPGAGPAGAAPSADPREGDVAYEQAKRLMAAVSAILEDAAKGRAEGRKLPKREEFVVPPFFAETREDRDRKVQALLDSALAIVTDVPVVETQRKVEGLRRNIRDIENQIAGLREKQVTAPKDAMLPGVLTDTVDSLETAIVDRRKRIDLARAEITAAKAEITAGLQRSGLRMTAEQVDLLLDSVLSGDLVRLMAVFNAVKAIDQQLGKLMAATGENLTAARRYFAMHAALFALLVHTQDQTIARIDTTYLPKLDAILADVTAARQRTADLLRQENRPDQRRALDSNRAAQSIAEDAAKSYRRYLRQQREQLAKARAAAAHDLRIADNTYETVEASVQLRNLMRDGQQSFEALQRLEAPTFDQLFRNEELRREFENLTRKLDVPTS